MAGMLSIGVTGLNAAQAGLTTTSHNIANASTPGFSRQSIVQTQQPGLFSGAGFLGQGTQVETVRRSYSQYLENQVLSADTKRSALQTYEDQISQLDNLLADSTVGLSPALQGFFEGVQEVAANPSSVPARQAMISGGEAMASRFQYLDARLSEIRDGVEGSISSTVETINSYSSQIAELNQRIVNAEAAGAGAPANDLHDTRDNLIRELNQLVRVSTVAEADGSRSVFIGNGQPLVVGVQTTQLTATPSTEDPSRLAIGLQLPNGSSVQMPESLLSGGTLGGLLDFRRDSLDTAQNKLGMVAVGLIETFNAQHRLGQDLDGNLGGDFFTPLSPSVQSIAGATSTPTVDFGDIGKLNGGTYKLTYTNTTGGYNLVDRATGNSVNAADVGLTITAPGTTVAGESFLIQPTRFAAQDINVAIGDTRLIAAAGPVRSVETAGNLGSGSIDAVKVNSIAGFASGTPHIGDYTLSFNSGSNIYEVRDSTNTLVGSVAYNPSTDSAGVTRTLPAPLAGIDLTFSGVPSNGDSFTLESNAQGVADNTNAVALGALQTTKTMLAASGNPTANFQSTYSNLVAEIGNKTSEVKVNRTAQQSLLDQATATRESLSGVNLDEEAANLIRYQQAYQASAKVMSIASSLFDEILGIAR
ncbi:flagellar hook-associated protein FlgK [Nitrogeniibacter mangrovi]|uniref:Flagellar hook-associated protein 1 n=1 Tax=Nitrogeniibacter mangrovi TaxID=2016596 RepID=A0A6C1B7Z8_9RHOO|nr:flagellar hook-associated protein FlgK [Nitrogeniibacter mangrovi]QID18374.1 flagellar hook-associated protein FlgK [Nitrogeniibacter mangrovi]